MYLIKEMEKQGWLKKEPLVFDNIKCPNRSFY